LKFKLEQLMHEIKENWEIYLENREILIDLYKETMINLHQTYKEMGKRDFNLISKLSKLQYKPNINVKYLKKIGALFFEQIIVYAKLEDIMLKISFSYKKINRRIKGLKNVIIPELQFDIKKIKDILEENERENYVRLKNTKDLITREIQSD